MFVYFNSFLLSSSTIFEIANKMWYIKMSCTRSFTNGTLYPTYRKPFDLIAEGVKTQNWGGFRDDLRTFLADVDEPIFGSPLLSVFA